MTEKDPLLTPPEGIPVHTDQVDVKLEKNLRQAQRTRWLLVIAVFFLLAGAVVVQTLLLVNQQNELNASCAVWRSISPLPVTPNPQTGRPTKLSVSIIAGARTAYDGQHCGKLPPPDPSLTRWASFYNIPLPQ